MVLLEGVHLWGRRGIQVAPPESCRAHWSLRPGRGRMRRRLHRLPGTRSGRCRQTEWRRPCIPALPPGSRRGDWRHVWEVWSHLLTHRAKWSTNANMISVLAFQLIPLDEAANVESMLPDGDGDSDDLNQEQHEHLCHFVNKH